MSQIQPLEDGDSEDEERRVSFRKKELEVFVVRILDRRIHQVIEQNVMPMLSRIVQETVELAGEKLLARLTHNSGSGIRYSDSRNLQLVFLDKLYLPVYTNTPIKGEGLNPLRVALVNGITKQVVNSGPEASAKVEIVVVEGDFDGNNCTLEELNNKIVREKEGKKCLLSGNVHLNLAEGVGFVHDISFTHNANWMKVCELRLGAKFVDNLNGVRGAVTEPFIVKDFRVTYSEKHYPPSLKDEVWRLKKIRKDGPFHNRLVSENIYTVKDFLTRCFINPQSLRNILGTAKKWDAIVDHARTCILDKSLHLYFPVGSEKRSGVVFNVVGQAMGLISECSYIPVDMLSEDQKADANKLVVSALEHMEEVKSFDNETCLHSYLQLPNDAYPPNSPRLESPSQFYCEPSHTHYGHDHTQPSTSSQNSQVVPFHLSDYANPSIIPSTDTPGIMSFAPSPGNASDLNEYRLQNIEYDIIYGDSSIFPGNCLYPSINYPESTSQTFGENHLLQLSDNDNSFQYQYSNSAPEDDLTSIVNGFLLSRAAADGNGKAERRWSMLFRVLRSKRKIAALKLVSSEAVLASKMPRIY